MRLTPRRLAPVLAAALALVAVRPAAAAPVAPAAPAAEEATPDKSLGAAKEAFESAQSAFVRGEYLVAAERFISAYEHKPYPAFLFNVAVSFEKAKQLEKARDYFTRYLEKDPNANDAAQVKLRLDVINQLLAPPPPPPRRRRRHRPVAPTAERRPPPRRPRAQTEARLLPERRPVRHRPPARRRSRRRRHRRRRHRCRC